jgi:hypothetical protein
MSVEERRRSPRAVARCLVGYARRLDVRRFAVLGVGSTIDVSVDGIKLLVHESIPEHSRLELELVLDGHDARIEEARVLRVTARPDGAYEVAARFEKTTHGSRAAIATYVQARAAQKRHAA